MGAEAGAGDLGPDVPYFLPWAVPLQTYPCLLGGGQPVRTQRAPWLWCPLQPVSLERMRWWGWGRYRSSCAPLVEQRSGFDPPSLPVSMRGRRGKCPVAMLLHLPQYRLQWEPAAAAPVPGSAWADSEGSLQPELKIEQAGDRKQLHVAHFTARQWERSGNFLSK